mgnify:CR=1 FL=1
MLFEGLGYERVLQALPHSTCDQRSVELRVPAESLTANSNLGRLLSVAGAQPLSTVNLEERLVRLDAQVDVEPIVLLCVTCPSTRSHYALRVPPYTSTCEQAQNWIRGGRNLDLIAES